MSYKKSVQRYLRADEGVTDDDTPRKMKQESVNKERKAEIFEIREVEQLNSHITTASKSSGIIERLNRKRKRRHDELMKKLASDLNEVNVKTEENIRISSEEVKAHIKYYKDQIEDKLKSLDTPEYGGNDLDSTDPPYRVMQVASYHESVFLDIQREASRMKSHLLELVEELYADLIKFENDRWAENERIFHSSFQEIEKTAYMLPYQVQSYIEHEALKMNQLTLNNRRCYEDLKLNLTLVTEEMFKSFMDEVFCLKEKWTRYNMQEALDKKYLNYVEKEKPVIPPPPQTRLELKKHMLPLKLTPDKCFNIVKIEDWFWNTNDVSNAVEISCNVLIDLYHQVIKAVEKDMRHDFDELKKCFVSHDVGQFEQRIIQPIMFESSSPVEENMHELELYWQNILKEVKGKLEEKFDTLMNFGELWNRHIRRLCECKILVLKAVEKAEENSTPALQDLEVKVNLSLDALRQEYNESKLESLYSACVANLDAVKEKLESDYINEVTVTENYYKMMNLEADVLSSEIREFVHLELSEREDEFPEMEPEFGERDAKSLEFRRKSREILGMADLKSAKSELKDALESFADNTRERVAWRAEDWVTSKVREISGKYQSKLEIHHKRYDRIRIQVYQVRQQEIYVHQSVFDEHKAGAEEIYRKIAEITENFHEKSLEKLENSRLRVESVIADAKKEEKASSVKCIQTQMQKQKADFMTEIAMKAEQSQQEIEFRVSSIQQSNLKFMKCIKLFHENGNYDADEGKTYITWLENIDKESGNEGKSAMRDLRKKETEILQKTAEVFDDAIRTLMQLDEELRFHATVGNCINQCVSDFQELSAVVKADFECLSNYCDVMGVCVADETAFLSEDGDRLCFLLITSLYKNLSNLFYVMDAPRWSDTTAEKQEPQVNPPEKTKPQTAKSDYPCKDYREEIFESSLLTETAPAFINAVCKKCWNCMDNLQRTGYAFYKNMGSKSLIRTDLLKSSYDDFGSDTCHVFRSFAVQCESVWLQMMHGCLPILSSVKTLLKTYFERRVREYAQRIISTFDDYDIEFSNHLNRNCCRMLTELQTLENKLLTLHGCPRNSHMLSTLEDEVVAKTAELELSWETFMREYEVKLKSLRKLCTTENEEYQALKSVYTQCKDTVFVEELGGKLLDFMTAVVERNGFVKKTEADGEGIDSQRRKLSLQHLEGGVENADTYFREIKKIILRETGCVEKGIEMMGEDWLEPRLGLLTDAEEFDEMASHHVKKLKGIYREIKQFLESKKNLDNEVIFEWLDKWKSNLDKNFELYTVKYPHVD